MRHDQIVREIITRARHAGVLTHYCGSAERCTGDRGSPDLVCAGPYGIAFMEVKTDNCPTLSASQTRWRYQLIAAGQRYHVVGEWELDGFPSTEGSVDWILGQLTTAPAFQPRVVA